MNKKTIYLLCLGLFVIFLAACGGEDPTPTAAPPTPELLLPTAVTDVSNEVGTAPSFCDTVDPSQISINTMGLPYPYQVNCIAATPYDASMPPGPVGLPEHIEINFGTLDPAANNPSDPIIYIIPADAYVAMWDAAGNNSVSTQMQQLRTLISAKPQTVPSTGMPVLPMEEVGGVLDLAVQGKYMDFGTWDGFRFVGRFSQGPNPVTNQGLQYIFQGFAGPNDEVFISMFWPVTTPFLPNDASTVPQAEMDAVNSDSAAYMQTKTDQLNQLTADDWNPTLNTLDEVIASLQYGPPQTPPGPVPTVVIPTPAPQVPYGRVTAANGVNVRTGPSTAFPIIGVAPFGTEGEIIGRSADGQWWVTPIQGAPNNQGWVSIRYVQANNVENVPVIQSPPPPVPTATPTPLPTSVPTPVPVPQINFWADSTTINQGGCTTLRWDVQNIQAVWVYPQGENFANWPVTGQGSRQVCPTVTTTYEMRVQHTNGSVELRQITITVNQNNPLVNSNWSLASMNVTGVLVPGTSITAFFGTGNFLSGNGGCNTYSGSYTVVGNSLTVGNVSSSMAMCGDEISQQESLYLSLLRASATFEIQGNQLVIRNVNGQEILRYNRM